MLKKTLGTAFSLALIYALAEASEQNASASGVREIVLELDYGLPPGWGMESKWFELVNTTDEIQEIVDGCRWYNHTDFKQWEELKPVSIGLWALFYQERAPVFGMGPPCIGYNRTHSTINHHHNIYITYFMYGSCSMHFYADGKLVQSIDNPCGKVCSFDFVTTKVALNDEAYSQGKYEFNITFNASQPGDFILIDKIQVDNVTLTTPSPCDCKPCDQILDDDSESSVEGWEISEDSLQHFSSIEDIVEALDEILPPTFNYSMFEGSEGIWVASNESDLAEPPSFSYSDDEFDSVEVTCYLHSDSSLSVNVGDSLEPEEFYNEEEEENWLVFTAELNGADKFRIQVNLTTEGYFAFVDKIVARRSACQVSEGSTTPAEICVCPTTPMDTTFEPPTRPSDGPEDPATASTIIASSSAKPGNETGSTTTDSIVSTTELAETITPPGGPNGERNLAISAFFILLVLIGTHRISV